MAGDYEDETGSQRRADDEPAGRDPLEHVRGISRVRSVQPILVPIFHEPPAPPPSKPRTEPAVGLRMVSWSAAARKPQMATMSDLGKNGTRGGTPTVARNPKFAVDDPKPTSKTKN